MKCLDYTEVVDESGLTGIQTNKLFWHFTQVSKRLNHISVFLSFYPHPPPHHQVENTVDPVGSLIEIYKQTDNIILSRLVVIQVL